MAFAAPRVIVVPRLDCVRSTLRALNYVAVSHVCNPALTSVPLDVAVHASEVADLVVLGAEDS